MKTISDEKEKVCFQCDEPITPENNGICINEGTPHEMYQCDDCHFSEFGYHIWGQLLVYQIKNENENENEK
jgi:hypothetical protein